MDKLEQILDLIDHPERYSAQQMESIMEDDECRRLYETLVDVDAAVHTNTAEPDLDEEWAALQRRTAQQPRSRKWQQIAASFVGILIVSGIAFAAIRLARRPSAPTPQPTKSTQAVAQKVDSAVQDTLKVPAKKAPIHKTYENVSLQNIATEIANYYGLKPVFRRNEARQLRLYYEWDSHKGLDGVVNDLNQFENISVTVEAGQLIVE